MGRARHLTRDTRDILERFRNNDPAQEQQPSRCNGPMHPPAGAGGATLPNGPCKQGCLLVATGIIAGALKLVSGGDVDAPAVAPTVR